MPHALKKLDTAFIVCIAQWEDPTMLLNTCNWWLQRAASEIIVCQVGVWSAANAASKRSLNTNRPPHIALVGLAAGAALVDALARYKAVTGQCHVAADDSWGDDGWRRPLGPDVVQLRRNGRPFGPSSDLGRRLSDLGFDWALNFSYIRRRVRTYCSTTITVREHVDAAGAFPGRRIGDTVMYNRMQALVRSRDALPKEVQRRLRVMGSTTAAPLV